MLAGDEVGPELLRTAGDAIFDPQYWSSVGRARPADRGRGGAWYVGDGERDWVLRHYRRGGWAAKIVADRYLWTGEDRVRAFAEWRLLDRLWRRGLPVPRPVAAQYRRDRWAYRCDLLTCRIPDARPLSAWFDAGSLSASAWRAIGRAIAALHRDGVDHADLNAHNVLLDADGRVIVIDFDRGRLRRSGRWTAGNLRRLRRSLQRIGADRAGRAFEADWRTLLDAYGSELARAAPSG